MNQSVLLAVVNLALLASIAADSFLLVHALILKDGTAWTVWRAKIISGLCASIGALLLTFSHPSWVAVTPTLFVGLCILISGRLAGALANFMLAFHLRRLIERQIDG